MRLPVSNLVTSLIENRWSQDWGISPLVADHALNGFSDFLIEDVFPGLSSISTQYELEWEEFSAWATFLRQTWMTPVTVSALYLGGLVLGQRLMTNRRAFDLKYPLFVWNLGLAIFSIMGVLHLVPTFFYGMVTNGPMYYICRNGAIGYGRGPVGFWTVLFVLSKYAELVDTVFLVLRKKPVPFLHWFHHFTVLLISIGSIMIYGPTGMIMISMNYFVHSIMYTYYAIAAITKPPKWGKIVTVLQIAQMIGGLVMCMAIYYGSKNIENCDGHAWNGYGIAFIYLSYFILFVRFYVNRYMNRPLKENPKKSD